MKTNYYDIKQIKPNKVMKFKLNPRNSGRNYAKRNVQKVLLKKCLRKYKWFSDKAYKYVHNRFRWFMLTHHYYDYKLKRFIITNVSYDQYYSSYLYINYSIGDKNYIYRCDLRYLDL